MPSLGATASAVAATTVSSATTTIPWYHLLTHPLKGLAHGLTYGTKIRAPHALVMTLLFKTEMSIPEKFKRIVKLTFLHARNLATFVTIYKFVIAILGRVSFPVEARPLSSSGHPARQWHALVAGAVGGWIVWSHYNAVNYQIVLYLLSRIVVALVRVLARRKIFPFNRFSFKPTYPYLAIGTWSLVMWLFEFHPETLHGSLADSMRYLYHESNTLLTSPSHFVPSWPSISSTLASGRAARPGSSSFCSWFRRRCRSRCQ